MKYLLPAYTGLGNTVQLSNVINVIKLKDEKAIIYFISDNKLGQLNFLDSIESDFVKTKLIDNKISMSTLLWIFRHNFDYTLLPCYGTSGSIKIMAYIACRNSIIEHDVHVKDVRIQSVRMIFCYFLRKNIKMISLEKSVNEIEKYKDLLEPIKSLSEKYPSANLSLNVRLAENFLEKNRLNNNYICIQIGAANRGKTPKTWPKENYLDLIGKLSKKYPEIKIVLIGDDISLSEDLLVECEGEIYNFVGKTSINELMALIFHSQLIICLDSAIMHLSHFLEKPLIGIFGPTEYKRTFPKGRNNHIVKLKMDCMPCMDILSDEEALEKCQFNNSCMKNLEAKIVFSKIQQENLIQ